MRMGSFSVCSCIPARCRKAGRRYPEIQGNKLHARTKLTGIMGQKELNSRRKVQWGSQKLPLTHSFIRQIFREGHPVGCAALVLTAGAGRGESDTARLCWAQEAASIRTPGEGAQCTFGQWISTQVAALGRRVRNSEEKTVENESRSST